MKTIVLMLLATGVNARAAVGCAPTVEAAVRGVSHETGDAVGYRVAALRGDVLRDRRWALVEVCGRPEIPMMVVPIPHEAVLRASTPVTRFMVVHVGDEVTVSVQAGLSRMVLHGWAEESGAVEGKVRVRLPKLSDDEGAPTPTIECVVTSAGNVEVKQ